MPRLVYMNLQVLATLDERQFYSGFAEVMKYGLIKERMSALLTDAVRANLLEQQGYAVQILEFIEMEHTPKNLLIRAVKTEKKHGNDRRCYTMCKEFGICTTLEDLWKWEE